MRTLLASVFGIAMVFALNGCAVGGYIHPHHHHVHHYGHHNEVTVVKDHGAKGGKVVQTKKVEETKTVVPATVDETKK